MILFQTTYSVYTCWVILFQTTDSVVICVSVYSPLNDIEERDQMFDAIGDTDDSAQWILPTDKRFVNLN